MKRFITLASAALLAAQVACAQDNPTREEFDSLYGAFTTYKQATEAALAKHHEMLVEHDEAIETLQNASSTSSTPARVVLVDPGSQPAMQPAVPPAASTLYVAAPSSPVSGPSYVHAPSPLTPRQLKFIEDRFGKVDEQIADHEERIKGLRTDVDAIKGGNYVTEERLNEVLESKKFVSQDNLDAAKNELLEAIRGASGSLPSARPTPSAPPPGSVLYRGSRAPARTAGYRR